MTFTVTITGATPNPEVYGGLPAAVIYVSQMISDAAGAFLALDPNKQAQYLRQASLWIDRQTWVGVPTTPPVASTTLKWPRTGVIEPDGTPTDPTIVPPDVVSATFEAMILGVDDQTFFQQADQSQNIRDLRAGSAGLSYFNATSVLEGTASILPTVIDQLVGRYFTANNGGQAVGGTYTGGGDGDNPFDTCDELTRNTAW